MNAPESDEQIEREEKEGENKVMTVAFWVLAMCVGLGIVLWFLWAHISALQNLPK